MSAPAFQRTMNAVWGPPNEPTIRSDASVEAGPLLDLLDGLRTAGQRVGPLAVVVRAAGHALVDVPSVNAIQRWGRLVPLKEPAIGVYLGENEGRVALTRIRNPHIRDLPALQARIDAVRPPPDEARATTHRIYERHRRLPAPVLRAYLRVAAFATYNLRLPLAGSLIHPDGWGPIAVTNLGTFGVAGVTTVPFPPIGRHLVQIAIGRIHDAPVARGNRVEVAPVLPIGVTLDHRAIVGETAAALWRSFRHHLTHPAALRAGLPAEASRA